MFHVMIVRVESSSVEALEAVAEHFLPSCTGTRLELLEKGAYVDVVGKLLEIEDARTVSAVCWQIRASC